MLEPVDTPTVGDDVLVTGRVTAVNAGGTFDVEFPGGMRGTFARRRIRTQADTEAMVDDILRRFQAHTRRRAAEAAIRLIAASSRPAPRRRWWQF